MADRQLIAHLLRRATFGPTAAEIDAAAQVDIDATIDGLVTPTGSDPGAAPGATETTRRMSNGVSELEYFLFNNPPRTQNWGQASAADRVPGTGAGLNNDNLHRIYGRIFDTPANQTVTSGLYTDTVLVTITY